MEYKNLPDINGWATLRAVIEKGGVQAAAHTLHVGQPAITKRLRALEACYGIALLEKTGSRLKLTSAGEKVYRLAVETLNRQVELREELLLMMNGQDLIRLEVTFSIGDRLLPDLLLQFSEQYRHYKIDTRVAYGRNIHAHLASGSVDIALTESAPQHPNLEVIKWREDELWLVCSKENFPTNQPAILITDLANHDFVLREHRSSSRQSLHLAFTQLGIEPLNVVLEVGSTDTIIEIISKGKHFSFLPKFAVEDRVSKGELAHIEVIGLYIPHNLWFVRRTELNCNPVVHAFFSTLNCNPTTKNTN